MGFGTGGLAPTEADTLSEALSSENISELDTTETETNAGVFVGFLLGHIKIYLEPPPPPPNTYDSHHTLLATTDFPFVPPKTMWSP